MGSDFSKSSRTKLRKIPVNFDFGWQIEHKTSPWAVWKIGTSFGTALQLEQASLEAAWSNISFLILNCWILEHSAIFSVTRMFWFKIATCGEKWRFLRIFHKKWRFLLYKTSKNWSPLDLKKRHGGDKSPLLVTLFLNFQFFDKCFCYVDVYLYQDNQKYFILHGRC